MHPDTPEKRDGHHNGAFAIVIGPSGKVLVADAKYGNRLGMLPGGGIYGGETPRAAARRELLEEFGIDLPESSLIHWGTFAQKSRGNDPHGPLLDGLLLAFEVHVDFETTPPHENDEAENQRFESPLEIFRAGEARYGTSCLRLLGRALTRGTIGQVEGLMKDKVSFSTTAVCPDAATSESFEF